MDQKCTNDIRLYYNKDLDENLALLTQKTEDPKSNNEKLTPPSPPSDSIFGRSYPYLFNNKWGRVSKHATRCPHLPGRYDERFLKKAFHEGTNFFGKNSYFQVILNGKANDEIMPKWGRSFKNHKCSFQ